MTPARAGIGINYRDGEIFFGMYSADMSVAIVKYDGTPRALRTAIELCNGFEELSGNSKVLLKPNLVWGGRGSRPPKYGLVTTSKMVEDLVQLLQERGCEDISIGEGSIVGEGLGSDTLQGYRWSGIDRVAKKYGVRLIDFNREPHTKVELDGARVAISNIALESDYLINLPVLKTHFQTRVSLGLKNLKGCLDIKSKMEFHRKGLELLIALLATQVRPKLTIVDGIYAMERGPDALGTAHRMNLILAGKDSLSCDMVGSTVLGIEPSSVEHLKQFASITKRSLDIGTIGVRGESIGGVTRQLEWRRNHEDLFFRQAGIQGVSLPDPGKRWCSGCAVPTQGALSAFCKDNMGIALHNVEICCGPEVRPAKESTKVFLIGSCSIQANTALEDAIGVKGCPPEEGEILRTLVENTTGKWRGRGIPAVKLLSLITTKLGIHDEDFPTAKRYESPEFDKAHF